MLAASRGNFWPVVFILLLIAISIQATGVDEALHRKHQHRRAAVTHTAGKGIVEDAEAVLDHGIERVTALRHYAFGGLSQLFQEFSSKLRDFINRVDPNKKLQKYWDFLGKEYDAGTYVFKMPELFKGMTLTQLANMANGALTPSNSRVSLSELHADVTDGRSAQITLPVVEIAVDISKPPAEYNFFEDYPGCKRPGLDQGVCGSCWAFAVANMLTHRSCRAVEDLRMMVDNTYVATPKDWHLAPQVLCSCCGMAICDTGPCDGGYVLEALKYLDYTPLYATDCAPYQSAWGNAQKQLCPKFKDTCAKDKLAAWKPKRSVIHKLAISVDNPKFTSVSSSSSNEELMWEVYRNGPALVTINTAASFLGYTGSGVFAAGNKTVTLKGKKHATHTLLVVGWGTLQWKGTGIPYWLLENSWGDMYYGMPAGSKHMVRIVRGSNDMSIESNGFHTVTPRVFNKDSSESSIKDGWPKESS